MAIPRTHTERAAHLAHLAADLVLPHRAAQSFPWHVVEALLAVARQDPGLDQDVARQLVCAALAACIEVEVAPLKEARP